MSRWNEASKWVVGAVVGVILLVGLHRAFDSAGPAQTTSITRARTRASADRDTQSLQAEAPPSTQSTTSQPSPSRPPATPSYTVGDEEDVSFANVKRLIYRVVVSRNATEADVRTVATDIVERAKARCALNAITALFYSDMEQIHGAYTVAQVDWAPSGEWGEAKSVKAGDYSRHAYRVYMGPAMGLPPQEPKKTAGLDAATRKRIFYELVAAEDRAHSKAAALSSEVDHLIKSYKADIRKRHGITTDQESEIVWEGISKNWPTPAP